MINYSHCSSSIKKNLSKVVRKYLNASGTSCPIYIVEGNGHPRLHGNKAHYTNKSGAIVRYPRAYARAWGKPIYIHSTLRIEVGLDWLDKNGLFIPHSCCNRLRIDVPDLILKDYLQDKAI